MTHREKQEKDIVAGVFRFRTCTTPKEIEEFLKGRLDDPGIVSLQVREVSKTQYGFQFVYDINKNNAWVSSYEDFVEKALDALYKHFGWKLQSWDLAAIEKQLK